MTFTKKQTDSTEQPIRTASLAVSAGVILMTVFLVSARAAPTTPPPTSTTSKADVETTQTAQTNTKDNSGVVFSSGQQKVSLIELYTSEGCSSCPPADRWLSALSDGTALWDDVVPLAFHVSYWDRLGWPDRFAQPKFDTRQRAKAARVDAGVYTPGLFKDGKEFRNWRRTPPEAIGAAHTSGVAKPADAGQLSISHLAGKQWQVTYERALDGNNAYSAGEPAQIFAAVLGNNLSNAIRRGENAGKRLNHDFVVLQLEQAFLTPVPANATQAQTLQATFTLDTNATSNPAIAAWVTDTGGAPLQAVGGAL